MLSVVMWSDAFEDQVDSSRDKCGRVGRVVIRLYSQHTETTLRTHFGSRGQIRLLTRSLIVSTVRRFISDEFSNASSHSTHCRVIVMSTSHRFTFLGCSCICFFWQPSHCVSVEVLVLHVHGALDILFTSLSAECIGMLLHRSPHWNT